jgi:LysR family transcriptional regulator, flagellar master operon regulator
LAEEKLVMMATPPRADGSGADHVQVDWGPEFALHHGGGPAGQSDPGLFVGLGPLGLNYILEAGGSGYFRLGAFRRHLESGTLELVPGAPEFLYPAYAVHTEAGDADLIQTALTRLRRVTGTEQAEAFGARQDDLRNSRTPSARGQIR